MQRPKPHWAYRVQAVVSASHHASSSPRVDSNEVGLPEQEQEQEQGLQAGLKQKT